MPAISPGPGPAAGTPGTEAFLPGRPLACRRRFPGDARQIREVRLWATAMLPRCPARDDVLLVATELGTNAVQHTASGHGGWFTVEITRGNQAVRVVVTDGGAPQDPRMNGDLLAETGRGLLVVRSLASHAGVSGDHQGRRVWADIPWIPGTPQTASAGIPAAGRSVTPAGFRRPAVPVPCGSLRAGSEPAATGVTAGLGHVSRAAGTRASGRQLRASSPARPLPGPAVSASASWDVIEGEASLAGTGRLADDLYLIAHDDRTGRPRLQSRAAGLGLAGGLLAELMLAGRIVIDGDLVMAAGGADPGDRLGRLVLGQVAGEPGQHGAGDWLEFLARTAVADVAGRLAEAGYLAWRPARRPRRSGRWVPANPSCAFTALVRAAGALHPARPLTAPGAALAALAAACGLGPLVTDHATPGARTPEDTAVFLPPALQYLTARTREAVDSALLTHRI